MHALKRVQTEAGGVRGEVEVEVVGKGKPTTAPPQSADGIELSGWPGSSGSG
jgi:hypothetical protein